MAAWMKSKLAGRSSSPPQAHRSTAAAIQARTMGDTLRPACPRSRQKICARDPLPRAWGMAPALLRRAAPSPIVKWVGGKTKLLDELTARAPKPFRRYFEPFLGGGALFLD